MSEVSFKIHAEALGKSLENISEAVANEIEQAVENLAHAAYAKMIADVQNKNMRDSNRQDYLKGLNFTKIENGSYLISLDGEWPNKLENGFSSYSMRDVLLNSKKIVQVGPRSGQPWVQTNAEGKKYAHVPFGHHPDRNGGSGDLQTDLKKLTAMNASGISQNITEIFKMPDGSIANSGFGQSVKPVAIVKELPDGVSKNLKNLAKFQHVHESGAVSTTYMTWRTISESGRDWMHPGHKGYEIFKAAEAYVKEEMDNLVKVILK